MNLINSNYFKELSKTKCYQYAEDVLSNKILASKKNILACKRFMKDLKLQEDDDFRWIFDLDKAYRPIEFMEKFNMPTKGDYDKMELLPWQHFIESNLYGWVDKYTGLRRFKEGLILVGRGNGKSTLVVGNAEYGATKDGERGAEVYLLANSKDQAGIIFNECKSQIQNSTILSKKFRTLRDVIYYDSTNSKIQHRASDSKKLDGLNTHVGIFDEIHEFKDFKLINVIKRSTNKRKQPLIIYISTLGTELNGALIQLYQLASDILNDVGIIDKHIADRFFCFIAEIDEYDDPNDSNCWIKANPSLGPLLKLETLKDDWNRAKLIPEERNDFINKQLNVFTNVDEMSMFDLETIKLNNKTCDIANLVGQVCYGGFDLSATEDFTSACLEFPLEDGNFFVLSHSWTTQKKVELNEEKIDYYQLQKAGLLTIINGSYVDYEFIFEWFIERSKIYNILSIGYDPANAPFLVNKLQSEGLALNVVRQGCLTLNAPLKDLKERFLDGKIVHNNNKLLNWYLTNVKLVKDRLGNWMPTKQNKFRKIDGFAALVDSHCEYIRLKPQEIDPSKELITVLNIW